MITMMLARILIIGLLRRNFQSPVLFAKFNIDKHEETIDQIIPTIGNFFSFCILRSI